MHHAAYTRRLFLQRGCALASLAATVPYFVERSALGMLGDPALSSNPGVPEDRVLVVVQLGGGNDGLNTVIPYGDPEYFRARPQIAVRAPGATGTAPIALELDPSVGLGLHASLVGFKDLYDAGMLSVVQGVGYPNPNRSHFVSTSIWETGDTNNRSATGWLGRYFDNACPGADPTVGMSFNKTQPESFGALKNPGVKVD